MIKRPEKRYKAIMVEDESTLAVGFTNPKTAQKVLENHSKYHVLRCGKDYKIVRDYDAELELQKNDR